MSAEKLSDQARRWFATAQDDFQTAEILFKNGKFPQTCFYAQQAGEKALKAVYYRFDLEPWGHSLVKLSKEFTGQDDVTQALTGLNSQLRELDRYYIPTRYPDGLPGTIPSEAYGSSDADSAINAATKILAFARNFLEHTQKR
jgi:HEPN domain-containing protein